jgi:hypothetical protein
LVPWRGWVAEQDAALVILRPEIAFVSQKVQGGIRALKATFGQANAQQKAAAASMDVCTGMVQAAGEEIFAVGLGAWLDKQLLPNMSTGRVRETHHDAGSRPDCSATPRWPIARTPFGVAKCWRCVSRTVPSALVVRFTHRTRLGQDSRGRLQRLGEVCE